MSFSVAERIAWDKKKKEENLEEWKAYHRELNCKCARKRYAALKAAKAQQEVT
jgi:hypothetical protein